MPGKTFPRSGKSTGEGIHGGEATDEGDGDVVCNKTEIVIAASRRNPNVLKENTGISGREFQNRSRAGARGVGGVETGLELRRNRVRSGVDRSPLPGSTWS